MKRALMRNNKSGLSDLIYREEPVAMAILFSFS